MPRLHWPLVLLVALAAPCHAQSQLPIDKGCKFVIIGNTLAERLQYGGEFESLLQSRFPEKQIVVRNLGWSADEIDLRPRSANFKDHGHELSDHRPNVILAMFGFNESFGGPGKLSEFSKRFEAFIQQTQQQAPGATLVVCSPIPHEDLQRAELPNGESTNQNLQLYRQAMQDRCAASGIRFIDLFTPMRQAMDKAKSPLTINGIHLNEQGNAALAAVLDQALFGARPTSIQADMPKLRDAVMEKDKQFFFDYRTVNGYYVFGGRKNPYGVINFPEEFAKLRKMIEVRDQRIWKLAAGEEVTTEIDDSSTGTLSAIVSNVSAEPTYFTPQQSRELMDVQEGYEIELFASEADFPALQKPVAIDFDARGRLWVTTTPTYPQYLPGTPPNDKVLILEDTDGNGKADKQTVFADGLHLPIGLALVDGGAYVSQQPDLMFFKDTNGDDVADQQERVLHGFDSADSHHSISAFTFGPDGALYMQEGTFHHTQVETPYGPQRVKDAAVFRYEPTTERFSVFVSYSFANPWGHCFDYWGQNFIADASPGANYFAAAFSGDVIYPQKHRTMEQFLKKQWRPTAACVIVNNSHFPEEAQGNYLINNTIGFLGTLQYKMRETGSGFAADPVDPLLSSRDTNFRPIDMKFGLDGSLYIVDWFNPLIGHMQHNLRDPKRDKSHGRIWRIRHKNNPLLPKHDFEHASTDELVRMLEIKDDPIREMARKQLRLKPKPEVVQAIDAWLTQLSPDDPAREHHHLEALWVMQQRDVIRPELLDRVLASKDYRARAAGARVLSFWYSRIEDGMARINALANDEAPRVRLEAVRAASFFADVEAAREVVATVMTKPLDYYLNYTINETNATLDRRGGSRAGANETLVNKIVTSQVESAQIANVVQLVAKEASSTQLTQIGNAIFSGKYRPEDKAAAIQEMLAATRATKVQAVVDTGLASERFTDAVQQRQWPLATAMAMMAQQWALEELTEPLRQAILENTTDGAVVDAALNAVLSFPTPRANDIRGELGRTATSTSLKLRFARAVASSKPTIAATALEQALEAGVQNSDFTLVETAAKELLLTPEGMQAFQRSLKQATLPPDLAKLLLRSVYATGKSDGPIVEQLSKAAGITGSAQPLTEKARRELIQEIEARGNADRGQWVYRRKELNCVQCHALSGAGGNVGPDLSGVGVTSPTEYLLDSILDPSKQIKEAYLTLNVLTADGATVRGVKLDRDDTRLILRDEKGKQITIAVEDIEAESEGKSLMPESLHQMLLRDELIDLIAFLSALGKPGDFVVNTQPTLQRFESLQEQATETRLRNLPEGQLEQELSKVAATSWQPLYALVNGKVVREMLPADKAIVILQGAVDVVVAGPLGVKVTSDADVQVVINGKSISSSGLQTVELPVGRQDVYFICETPSKLRSLVAEITKPSGAATQFTVVGGL